MTWLNHWLDHARLLSNRSTCPRGKVGAFIIDEFNNPVSAGFNGAPRKAPGDLCNINICDRDFKKIASGTSIEIGCHHAEMNAICNAAKKGISLKSCTIIISTNPCLSCAKMIHHAGLLRVVIPNESNYSEAGIEYLKKNQVKVISI